MTGPGVYDHVRPIGDDYPDGIYRVVGVDDETVTILRVSDADGRRVHGGEVERVDVDGFDSFTAAGDPDGNRSLGAAVSSQLVATGWSVRVFVSQLFDHPLASILLVSLVLLGAFGERWLPLPEVALDGLLLLGAAGLAYVGSGWIDRR